MCCDEMFGALGVCDWVVYRCMLLWLVEFVNVAKAFARVWMYGHVLKVVNVVRCVLSGQVGGHVVTDVVLICCSIPVVVRSSRQTKPKSI